MREYRLSHPGSFRMEAFVDWALGQGMIDLPRVNLKRVLVRRAKEAARAARTTDPQGREVREMLAVKVPTKVDMNGNILLFEVRYDHIHEMSVDYALLVFDQRDEIIKKQQKSATRDLESFLENNPNAVGKQQLFKFDFIVEGAESQAVQTIEETPPRGNKG